MISFQSLFAEVPLSTRELQHHPLFLTSNEEGTEKTLADLKIAPIQGNTMVGVSGFFLLNMAAVRGLELPETEQKKIETIILIDRAQSVEKFWERVKHLIKKSSTRDSFYSRLIKSIRENSKDYWGHASGSTRDLAKEYLSGLFVEMFYGTSWLSNERSFLRIKKIFDEDHFVFLRIDLTNALSTRALRSVLEESALRVDTLYISNVHEHVVRRDYFTPEVKEKEDAFFQGVENLVQPGTQIVQVHTRECELRRCKKPPQVCSIYNPDKPISEIFLRIPAIDCLVHGAPAITF